ncbi:MAG TPA: alpha/beta hydrolase-fold protein, partial [Anaerolineales bacterium]|nr:alpha/beta hydrolase-fold protein [Anaerolineales bacterium]
LTLPADAYVEYAYFENPSEDKRLVDPLNPRKTTNGYGKYNHYFYMPERHPNSLTLRRKGTPKGSLVHASLPTQGLISGSERKVHLYRPAAPGPYPLVLVWDGQDFLRRGRLPVILDNLINQGEIPPLALALVESRGAVRMLEYASSDFSLAYTLEGVLPFARQHLDLLDLQKHPGAYGVLGASMGGLMALYTGLRLPGIFGKVLSLSGAFSFPELEMVVFDLARLIDPDALRIWMNVGVYDILGLPNSNRQMAALLEERGFDFHFKEYLGGHNYTAWRDELGAGLIYLFGQ